MPDPLCPTCHSKIGTQSTVENERIQGHQGVDTDNKPIPRWTDDPLFTRTGLSGTAYKGISRIRKPHILEIQEVINLQEEELGLPITVFSDITEDTHISRRHIIELREAIEKILNVGGITLEEYFKFDADGAEVVQNPRLVAYGATNPQTEWVDVNRGEAYVDKDGNSKISFLLPDASTQDSPTLPSKTRIRAIHIEDIRHPLQGSDSLFVAPGGAAIITALRVRRNEFLMATWRSGRVCE